MTDQRLPRNFAEHVHMVRRVDLVEEDNDTALSVLIRQLLCPVKDLSGTAQASKASRIWNHGSASQ